MSESSNFRQINEIEKKIIIQSLSKISPNIFQFILRTKKLLYISLKKGNSKPTYPNIYLIPKYFQELINLNELNDKIFLVGLYFGFIKRSKLYLSLEGTEFLYKKGMLSDNNFVHVNKKGEKSILYGNDILKDMVSKIPSNLQKGDLLIIFNDMNELLAVAQSQVEGASLIKLKPKSDIAINLNDKGIYIREKQ